MQSPEKSLIHILKKNMVEFACTLPCEKIKNLLELVSRDFFHIPLTREEEGVGICAGLALTGKRPAMFVQSSGLGNMLNALLSLTGFYELPLAIFVSQRGIYKEKIKAQVPMGQRLPGILQGAGIPHSIINTKDDFKDITKKLSDVFKKNTIHAFLLSPALWGDTGYKIQDTGLGINHVSCTMHRASPELTRFEILQIIAPYLDSKVVICNLGFPSKELFHVKHQPSNFYMLGSMGMATPMGLGVALASKKQVVVIDGDGSLLMNPGSLATAAHFAPENLTIIAIDNGSYGSTGDQPTLTGSCVELEIVAKGFGIKDTSKVADKNQLSNVLKNPQNGLRFIHVLAVPGNKDVPNIPIHHLEVKKQVMDFLKSR